MLCGFGLQELLGEGVSRLVQGGGWKEGQLPCKG